MKSPTDERFTELWSQMQGSLRDVNEARPIPSRVSHLVAAMTIEEKVAQLSCVARTAETPWLVDNDTATATAELIRRHPHGVGQLGRPSQKRLPAESVELTNSIQQALSEQTRLGIPALFNEEGVHGHMAVAATIYPVAIALAATWDTALVETVFAAVAAEVRSRGSNYVYAPVLDVARDPRWGRTEETFGEDPHLVAEIGIAAVNGLQGTEWKIPRDRVLACVKHFAGHGAPEGGINAAPLHIGERTLREEHLSPFQAVVSRTSLGAIMAAYHEIDGIPCHANQWLLTEVLRGEWGFAGMVTSDGFGIPQLVSEHRVAADLVEAAALAITAGIDCEVPEGVCFGTLVDLIQTGRVEQSDVDRAVTNMLLAKDRLGLLEDAPPADAAHATAVVGSAKHRALALEAARRTPVLLQNSNDLLPLDLERLDRIAVVGPNAADVHLGGYAREDGPGISILEGIRERFGADRVSYAEGCRVTEGAQGASAWWADGVRPASPEEQADRIAEAVGKTREADVAVLVVGGNESTAREAWSADHLGDRSSLQLPGRQLDLIDAVTAAGTPTVAIVMGGRPLDLTMLSARCEAILQVWYAGQEGGQAVAEILAGDVNPAGKLPITLPGSAGQIPMTYRGKPTQLRDYLFTARTPLFPFGHGLSYTSFSYGIPELHPSEIGTSEETRISVEVTNTGDRSGTEIVQCYLSDSVASVTRPGQSLCGFAPLQLAPGDSATVAFRITSDHLSLIDRHFNRIVEPGTFVLRVGGSSVTENTAELTVR